MSKISYIIPFCMMFFGLIMMVFIPLYSSKEGHKLSFLNTDNEQRIDILEAQVKVILWEIGNINERIKMERK